MEEAAAAELGAEEAVRASPAVEAEVVWAAAACGWLRLELTRCSPIAPRAIRQAASRAMVDRFMVCHPLLNGLEGAAR
jgi:hypothetical protein